MPKTNHVFHFYGPVTPKSFENLRSQILTGITKQGAQQITILLSSEGGNLFAGFTAYSFLRALPVPVSVLNMNTVESVAVLLYLAADNRLAVPNSRFLLHSFNWGFNHTTQDHPRISEHVLSLDIDVERYANIFEERTQGVQVPIDIRQCLNGKALVLNATAASAAGIVSRIVPAEGAITCDDTHWWPDVCT